MKTINDFLFVLSPPPPVMDVVSSQKQTAKRVLGHGFPSESSLAHLSLFIYRDYHTDSLLHRLQPLIARRPPLYVSVKGVGFFTHGERRTIFDKVDYTTSICNLAEDLHWPKITPHITIARNISFADFVKLWPHLNNTSPSYGFICDHITVLIRNQERWKYYTDLPFLGCGLN